METQEQKTCPASSLLKSLSGKWKPEIFRLSSEAPLRFSSLLRQLPEASKQSITVALRDLQEEGLLKRVVVKEKPINVAYHITEKGKSLISVFEQLEQFS